MRRVESGFWAHRDINAEDPHLQYLRVDGYRPMEGDLDMDGYHITNVADPVDAQDAATKAYVDGYISLSGTWAGVLANGASSGGTNPIISIGDSIRGESDLVLIGASSTTATTAGEVNLFGGLNTGSGDAGNIELRAGNASSGSGGSILIQAGTGGSSLFDGAVTIVAPLFVSISAGGSSVLTLDGNTVDVKTQRIENVVDPVDAQDAATKNYVDGYIDNYLPLDGSRAMTGNLNMGTQELRSGKTAGSK